MSGENHAPKISVLLPVFNRETYVAESIQSILDQTRTDFELIIIDDGSTDSSAEAIRSFTDKRIRFHTNDGNKGISYTRNRLMDLARGEYLALMDSDDISLPERFARQAAYLDAHPDIHILGTCLEIFPDTSDKWGQDQIPLAGFFETLQNCPLAQPTVMIRKSFIDQHQLRYSQDLKNVEDFDLWSRAARYTKIANLPDILLRYRMHENNITTSDYDKTVRLSRNVQITMMQYIAEDLSRGEKNYLLKMLLGTIKKHELYFARKAVEKVLTANRQKKLCPENELADWLYTFIKRKSKKSFLKKLFSVQKEYDKLNINVLGMQFQKKIDIHKLPDYSKLTIPSHAYGGKIYFPYYYPAAQIIEEKPEIYNKDGRKMDLWFIRDIHSCHQPYIFKSKYFLWDRFNIGLDIHFYTQAAMLETMGNPSERYGIFYEPRSICPNDHEIFKKNKGLARDFDAVFTYDTQLLNELGNAKFVPFHAQPWFGTPNLGGTLDEQAYRKKDKNISMLCSAKRWCEFHEIRYRLAHRMKANPLVDTYGTFDGGPYVQHGEPLSNYRYSIVVENDLSDYYFTEKLTSCLAAQVVPIYLGARKINEFFNTDGMILITLDELDNLENILKICSAEDYASRTEAIIDNYQRSLKYRNIEDWIYETYFLNEYGQH